MNSMNNFDKHFQPHLNLFMSTLYSFVKTLTLWTQRRQISSEIKCLSENILKIQLNSQHRKIFTYGRLIINEFSFTHLLVHYSKKLKEHFDIMIFIERYPFKEVPGLCQTHCK